MVPCLALLLAIMTAEPEPLTRDKAIAEARQLVARQGGVEAKSLEVELAVAATWPDTALGCPEKDQMYAQVLTDGFRVVLRDGSSRRFDVRVTRGRAVLCGPHANDRVAVADIRLADRIQRLAKADLARRLEVPLQAVSVDFVRPKTWPDERLGCTGGSPAPEPKEIPGFELRLSHAGRQFSYHADHERVVACEAPGE